MVYYDMLLIQLIVYYDDVGVYNSLFFLVFQDFLKNYYYERRICFDKMQSFSLQIFFVYYLKWFEMNFVEIGEIQVNCDFCFLYYMYFVFDYLYKIFVYYNSWVFVDYQQCLINIFFFCLVDIQVLELQYLVLVDIVYLYLWKLNLRRFQEQSLYYVYFFFV